MIHRIMKQIARRWASFKHTKTYKVSGFIATVVLLQILYRIVIFLGLGAYALPLGILANASLGIAVFVAADVIFIKNEEIRKKIYEDSIAVAIYTGVRLYCIAWIIVFQTF